MLSDKYGRLRTDMEDMIEAHQENTKIWNIVKKHYESTGLVAPTVELPVIIQMLIDEIPKP